MSRPFLATLGASATIVAVVAGFGELCGYALRFVFGYAADRTGRYWPITLFSYTLQMVGVPLLALAGGWPVAALLIVAERTGRAIRNPARDAMLAHATGELGRGWVFGVREAFDAGGAMLGPLLVAAAIYVHGGYRVGFAVLLVPALLTLVVLLEARRRYPTRGDLEIREGVPDRAGIPGALATSTSGIPSGGSFGSTGGCSPRSCTRAITGTWRTRSATTGARSTRSCS